MIAAPPSAERPMEEFAMDKKTWIDVGSASQLKMRPLQQVMVGSTRVALVYKDGGFSAISGICNHAGGPLGEGSVDGDYVVCPWHYWKFHCRTGEGEPGFEADKVPAHEVRIEDGRVLVNRAPLTRRERQPHPPHPLAREVKREPGPIRVAGISTTVMNVEHPRYSTSEALLEVCIAYAKETLGCEARLIRLNELRFRACEGYYSKSARACTWPCSITQQDSSDQLDRVYEAFVHWADVLLIATPIRWGAASSLYYKMVERMNCIQNQSLIANKHLLSNKVAGFIITGGQDNVQGVAGQMLGFFAEVGCQFPQFPFIAHSRGWSAEDMENNNRFVQNSKSLREGAQALVNRSVEMARLMVGGQLKEPARARGGRKAHQLDVKAPA
jgi:nitrite reductase/ring-hydroxylating ferredoxin subunit/multimeric flavodoxin WrbA